MGRDMDVSSFPELLCQETYLSSFLTCPRFPSTEIQLLYPNRRIVHLLLSYLPCEIRDLQAPRMLVADRKPSVF